METEGSLSGLPVLGGQEADEMAPGMVDHGLEAFDPQVLYEVPQLEKEGVSPM
jgi:hypothetical protein